MPQQSRARHLTFLLLLALGLVASACGNATTDDDAAIEDPADADTQVDADDDDDAPPPDDAEVPESVTIGGSFTLSGSAAFLGLFEEAAVRLAVEHINEGTCVIRDVPCEGGGLNINGQTVAVEWVAYDDQGDSRLAIDNITRLVESDNAAVVWGPRMNSGVVATGPMLEEQGVIQVCSICSSPAVTVGRDLGLNMTDTGVLEKHAIGAFIHEDPSTLEEAGLDPDLFEGRTRTAFIARDELYSIHGARGWQNAIDTGGNQYEFDLDQDVILYPEGTTDFAPFVSRMVERDPDIVVLDAYVVPDMLGVLSEMKSQGLDFEGGDVIVLGNDVLMLDVFPELAAGEGMDLTTGFVYGFQEIDPDPDPESVEMIEEYTALYDEAYADTEVGASSPFDRSGYNAAMRLFAAMQEAGGVTDARAIMDSANTLVMTDLRGTDQQIFVNPDTGEPTGQLLVTEYIMGHSPDGSGNFWTGISYRDELYYSGWVFGDALPEDIRAEN